MGDASNLTICPHQFVKSNAEHLFYPRNPEEPEVNEAEEKKGGDHVETKQSCFNSHLSDSIHYLPAKHGALVAPMRARTSKQKRIHLYSRPCQLIRHPFCRQMDLEFIAENTAA